jgi:hypothetical protein
MKAVAIVLNHSRAGGHEPRSGKLNKQGNCRVKIFKIDAFSLLYRWSPP